MAGDRFFSGGWFLLALYGGVGLSADAADAADAAESAALPLGLELAAGGWAWVTA